MITLIWIYDILEEHFYIYKTVNRRVYEGLCLLV
jgi:hypothetical protein